MRQIIKQLPRSIHPASPAPLLALPLPAQSERRPPARLSCRPASHRCRPTWLVTLACLFVSSAAGWAADVTIPSLQLATRGTLASGLTTKGRLEMVIEGGLKLGGRVLLALDGTSLEQSVPAAEIFDPAITPAATSPVSLNFLGASIEIREALGAIDLQFFVGEGDTFASGDTFSDEFGAPPIATRYRGFFTFASAPFYDGLHEIHGTGIKIGARFGDGASLALYGYQDGRVMDAAAAPIPGVYSSDLRLLLNSEHVKLESFLGGTYPLGSVGVYRTGLLFHAGDQGVEFFAQIGIPRWDPLVDPLTLQMFYLLFEPRLSFGMFSIVPTFFWQPAYYLQQSTPITQAFDVNLNFLIGNSLEHRVSGGLQSRLQFDQSAASQIAVTVAPFISFLTAGAIWEIKVDLGVVPFDLASLAEVFVGVTATF